MSQRSDNKPAGDAAAKAKPEQTKSTELSAKDLDQVAGGLSDIHITKTTDSSSPHLFADTATPKTP